MPQPRPAVTTPEAQPVIAKLTELGQSSRAETELPELLRRLFRERTVQHPDGHTLPLKCEQDILNCAALHRVVQTLRPERVLEIGMAYGVSTLSSLTALQSNERGKLISIDPYIGWATAGKVAHHQIALAGLTARHEHVQDLSQYAMPRMIAEGLRPELIYIDGHHGIEYVMVDTFFADKMLVPGGVVAFNDVGWPSVHKVIRFLERYRDYREVRVGLPLTYKGRNPLFSLARRVQRRSNHDRYFVKNSDWEFGGYQGF